MSYVCNYLYDNNNYTHLHTNKGLSKPKKTLNICRAEPQKFKNQQVCRFVYLHIFLIRPLTNSRVASIKALIHDSSHVASSVGRLKLNRASLGFGFCYREFHFSLMSFKLQAVSRVTYMQ